MFVSRTNFTFEINSSTVTRDCILVVKCINLDYFHRCKNTVVNRYAVVICGHEPNLKLINCMKNNSSYFWPISVKSL